MSLTIRHATLSDLDQIVQILNPYILNTAVTFDTEPYTVATRKPWFDTFRLTGPHQCFVAEKDNVVLGYACSAALKPKKAYDTSVEVSIYQPMGQITKGLGSLLYSALFQNLSKEDVHRAHALIAMPNDASYFLHKKFGFNEVGVLNEAGRKLGRYHDVCWLEKKLR